MRLSEIDDSNRGDHYHLTDADTCYYLFEYTSGQRYDFSRTNQLISNLKKKPSLRHRADYRYKQVAINQCAMHFRTALNHQWLNNATLVPVPCSKAIGHPDYDDRMERVSRSIAPNVDVRPMVIQTQSTTAFHEAGGDRATVEELIELYQIDEAATAPAPGPIAIVDDVLTAGTHYRAMHTVLRERFPAQPIVGLFVARRVFPDIACEFDDLDL
jgi:predicted amidophosphoribosyltransferase